MQRNDPSRQDEIPFPLRGRVYPRAQLGAALLVALILLVVIILVGLAAIGTTILQNKAASNQYDRQIAFQAAEAALRQAQVNITTNTSSTAPAPTGIEDCSTPSGGSTPANVCLANPFSDPTNTGLTIVPVTKANFNAGGLAAAQPQYVIQYMGQFLAPTPPAMQTGGQVPYGASPSGLLADYYRITARSGDPTTLGGRAIVTLQSTFRD